MIRPAEGMSQAEVVLHLRRLIDTAIAYPSATTEAKAIEGAMTFPRALRSAHVRHNLGQRRWNWLNERGIYPAMDPGEIAGVQTVKGTITPEVIK